jgi:outer membrane protein
MKYIALTIALCAVGMTPTFAQKAGSWSASVGVTQIAPDVTSGNLTAPSLPSTQVDVGNNTQLTGGISYAMSDNFVVHLPLGFGFKHKVVGTSAIAGVGTIATTKALPITLIGQYVKFFKETGTAVLTAITNPGGPATTLSFESKLAPTIQLGAVFNLNEKWYLDASYTKTFLKTRGTLSTGQTLDAKLDPNGYTLQIGYKF